MDKSVQFFNLGGAVFTDMRCVGITARPSGQSCMMYKLTFRAPASRWLRSTLFSEIGVLKSAQPKFDHTANFTFIPCASNSHTLIADVRFRVIDGGQDATLEIVASGRTWDNQVERVTLIELGGWLGDKGVLIMTPRKSIDELGLGDVAEPVTIHTPYDNPTVRMARNGEIEGLEAMPTQTTIAAADPGDFVGSAGDGEVGL